MNPNLLAASSPEGSNRQRMANSWCSRSIPVSSSSAWRRGRTDGGGAASFSTATTTMIFPVGPTTNRTMPTTAMGRSLWLMLIPALLLSTSLGVTQCNAQEPYYSVGRLHLNVPISKEAYIILRDHPLLSVSLPSRGNTSEPYRYSIESPTEPYLKVNDTSGDIWIASHFLDLQSATEFIIAAYSQQNGTLRRLSLTITPVPLGNVSLSRFCEEHVDTICFWDRAVYKIQENEIPGFAIGPLGADLYRKLCRTHSVRYQLNNATNYLSTSNGTLYSVASLDHDSAPPGPLVKVSVRCMVQFSGNDVPQEFDKTVDISVLDRNDNRPRLQHTNDTHIELVLDDPHIEEGEPLKHLNVLFFDKDTIALNSHVHYQLLNDSYQLFEPKCITYEIDRDGRRQTVFSCTLIARKTGILPKGRYCVVLQALDDTVSNIDSNLFNNSTICIDPNHNRFLLPRPEPLISGDLPIPVDSKPARSGGGGKKRSSNRIAAALANFTYPDRVELYNSASQYARVAQPSNMYDQITESKTNLNYRILSNPLNAFDITESAGIIYLKDATAIRKQPTNVVLRLLVGWLDHNATIGISIKHSVGVSCNVSSEDFCSRHPNQTSCVNSCGVGSLMGNCMFRIPDPASAFSMFAKQEESTFDENYPTCTPDLSYCPDNVCDPLEDMAHRKKIQICPQDCVYPDEIIGVFERLHTSARGIHMSGAGACTCRSTGQCDCFSRLGIKKEHRKNNTKTRATKTSTTTEPVVLYNGTDGASSPAAVRDGGNYYQNGLINGPNAPMFLLAIVVIPMIVAVLLVSYCFSRKTGLKEKLTDGNNIPMRMVSNETEVFNVDLPLNSRINDINFKIDFDSKWEFPRANLILDITLGSGEFGKVLKAYATDLPEKPGITTVAVKMLKTGANSVELLALLSEYQLLQEVTHPNVIRLLGACTKGESPLLIIEYCQYGSLKNYLRLSRKLEVMDSTDYENAIEPITVKDILSFAWQISKGMAYLTEIKLVHRDLAARNVLLAEGKVCKISDFGLTRDVYEDDAYLKKSKDRVPVKWMAPESLADHIYTTKSDVWAFGVVCWELITLGASPYPGIPPQNLYTLLKQGYRMECPKNCSEEIYSIVRSCWSDDPKLRPSFKYLAGQFEQLLGRTAKYIDMEQNSISNPVYCENTDETDCSKVSFVKEEQARLENLWTTPQYESATDSSTLDSIRYLSPITDKKSAIQQSYDTPRPLIETATIEQKLRYENDVRLRPKKIHNFYPPSSTPTIYINSSSHPNLLSKFMDETSFSVITGSEYDSPNKQPRPVSYLDMNKNSVNLNLEINNIVDKKQSKDIAFRFSSVDNDLQTMCGGSCAPAQETNIPVGRVQSDPKMVNSVDGRDEVDYPIKMKNEPDIVSVTVTSTV
ncbi:uncharacterized protein LOC134212267 [Armigeres subalbatus]|uniref:uncharacterized protein LOC134212267 n=1 Tax=Armigeres subalbatus TaxID=124917 RepID=UPI002ECFE2B9